MIRTTKPVKVISKKRIRILEVHKDIADLKEVMAKTEKTKSYSFRWKGKVQTLYSAERVLHEYENQLILLTK